MFFEKAYRRGEISIESYESYNCTLHNGPFRAGSLLQLRNMSHRLMDRTHGDLPE